MPKNEKMRACALKRWNGNAMPPELRAQLDVTTQIRTQAEAIATLNAKLDAQAAAQGAFVAGFNNTMSQTVQKLDAGRDVNNTQFTTEMANVMERAFKTVAQTVYIMAGALVAVLGGGAAALHYGTKWWRSK